jgi:hypothetical protein
MSAAERVVLVLLDNTSRNVLVLENPKHGSLEVMNRIFSRDLATSTNIVQDAMELFYERTHLVPPEVVVETLRHVHRPSSDTTMYNTHFIVARMRHPWDTFLHSRIERPMFIRPSSNMGYSWVPYDQNAFRREPISSSSQEYLDYLYEIPSLHPRDINATLTSLYPSRVPISLRHPSTLNSAVHHNLAECTRNATRYFEELHAGYV